MGNYLVAGPNKALVFSGGCCNSGKRSFTMGGGGGCRWWGCSDVQELELNILTLRPSLEDVETKNGVAVSVSGVVQVKIMTNADAEQSDSDHKNKHLEFAAENFSGKTTKQIGETLLATIEGHLRAILGTMTVEDVYRERSRFREKIGKLASVEMENMGYAIKSFTIKDVSDKVNYLDSLGIPMIEKVKNEALAAKNEYVAQASTFQSNTIREYETTNQQLQGNVVQYENEYFVEAAAYEKEINQLRVQADLAEQRAKTQMEQNLTKEKLEIEVIQRRREIEIEEREAERTKLELLTTQKKPAEARGFQRLTQAEMEKEVKILKTKARAQAIRMKGDAEAASTAALGQAEADVLISKSEAYKQYGDAALATMIIEALPKYAAEVAAPLSKVSEMTVISGDNKATQKMTNLVGTLPPAVEALTGVDITEAMEKMMAQQ